MDLKDIILRTCTSWTSHLSSESSPDLAWLGLFLCLHLSSRDGNAETSPLPQRQKWHRNGSKSDNKRAFPKLNRISTAFNRGHLILPMEKVRHWCTNGLCKVKRALGWCEQNKERTRNTVTSIRPCTIYFQCILREKNLNFVFISVYSDQDTKCNPGIKCFHDRKTFFHMDQVKRWLKPDHKHGPSHRNWTENVYSALKNSDLYAVIF